jgi:undecaprenyl-diphosphatase
MSDALAGLAELDRSLLLWSQGPAHPVVDSIVVMLGNPWALAIPLAVIAMRPATWRGRSTLLTACAALLAVALVDGTGHLLKILFARPRPCHTLAGLRVLAGCGDSFSVPSNHAANMFALAAVLAHDARRARWPLFGLAAVIAYARVYVGAHYPSDVVGGAALGAALGTAVAMAVPRLASRQRALGVAHPSRWRFG